MVSLLFVREDLASSDKYGNPMPRHGMLDIPKSAADRGLQLSSLYAALGFPCTGLQERVFRLCYDALKTRSSWL